jgi:hypothetical protein
MNNDIIYFLLFPGTIIRARISTTKPTYKSDPFIPPSKTHITEIPIKEKVITGTIKGLNIFLILTK